MLPIAVSLAAAPGARALEAMRVVSLSPVASEIVLALGLEGRLEAVDAASARLPGLPALPVAEAGAVARFSPDLVLAPAAQAESLRRAVPGAEVLEIEPHDLDEAWDLWREIGAALGHAEQARRQVRERTRPLAEISAASFGRRRPRVAAIVSLAPLEIAGGHSFLTDVIELAGGESVSHGSEETRLAWSPEALVGAGAELVLLVGDAPLRGDALARARALVGPGPRLEPLVFDPERFWLDDPTAVVARVAAFIEALRAGEGG